MKRFFEPSELTFLVPMVTGMIVDVLRGFEVIHVGDKPGIGFLSGIFVGCVAILITGAFSLFQDHS